MAKNKFSSFNQLKQATIQPADLEKPEEKILVADSVVRDGDKLVVNVVDPQGEDLGDVDATPPTARGLTPHIIQVDELPYLGSTDAQPEGDDAESESTEEDEEEDTADRGDEDEGGEEPEPEPTLNDRPVQTWTTPELEAYIIGEVDCDVFHSTVEKAVEEHRVREVKLPAAWSLNEIKAFLSAGVQPSRTSKGAWVSDVTRKYRREHEWTTQELESWALGEIEPEGVTQAAGLAIALKDRLNLVCNTVDPESVIVCYKHATGQLAKPAFQAPQPTAKSIQPTPEVIQEVEKQIKYEGLNEMNQTYLEEGLKHYGEIMAPGRAVTEVNGGKAQKLLRELMNYAIGLPDPSAARSAMTLLLNHFKSKRGAGQLFEDTYAFRFIENMAIPVRDQEGYVALLTLFLVYADPMVELRAQTDTVSLIRGVPTQLQARVYEFFGSL